MGYGINIMDPNLPEERPLMISLLKTPFCPFCGARNPVSGLAQSGPGSTSLMTVAPLTRTPSEVIHLDDSNYPVSENSLARF